MTPGARIRVRENPHSIIDRYAGHHGTILAPEWDEGWYRVLLDRHQQSVDLHVADLEPADSMDSRLLVA